MEFEFFTLDIHPEMVALWNAAGLSYRPNGRDSRESFEYRIQNSPTYILGKRENGTLIAVVVLTHDGQRGWINRLAVHPDQQRKGIAKKLINASIEFFKSQKIYVWTALIEDYNTASMNLFASAHFVKRDDIFYYTKRISPDA